MHDWLSASASCLASHGQPLALLPTPVNADWKPRAASRWPVAVLPVVLLSLAIIVACNNEPAPPPTGPYLSGVEFPWADEPSDLSSLMPKTGFLSDAQWVAATNGWGPLEKNQSNGDSAPNDGSTLTLAGQAFSNGLGVHAPSRIQYHLGRTCTRFQAVVGVDDAVPSNANASLRFEVRSGATPLFDSGRMTRGSSPQIVDVDLNGRADLILLVHDENDGNAWDRADWANAQLTCTDAPTSTSSVVFLNVSEGETLSGRVRTPGANVIGTTASAISLEFRNEDGSVVETQSLNGTPVCITKPCGWWDTTQLADGHYRLAMNATLPSNAQLSDQVNFNIQNTSSGLPTPSGPSYYLDCKFGRDSNTGTSAAQPWLNINRVNKANLPSGAALYLKRGCSWNETLYVNWSGTTNTPALVASYGSGARPAIRNAGRVGIEVSGSDLVLDNLEVTSSPPPVNPKAVKCPTQPVGKQEGVLFVSGASRNTLQNSRIAGMSSGVRILEGNKNKIINNEFAGNNVMENLTPEINGDDVGAQAVVLNSNENEVAYNTFWGHKACSEDFTEDGAALEVFMGSKNFVHHNRSIWGDSTFAELGGLPTALARDNVFAYNLYVATGTVDGSTLVVRGNKSTFGANPGTKFYNNTAFNVSIGTSCFDGCSSAILGSHNNIFVQRDTPFRGVSIVYADAPFDEGHNLYFKAGNSPLINIEGGSISLTSRVADPRFVNPWNGNFTLAANSPALAAGVLAPVAALGIKTDLAGTKLPTNGALDLGAFERP